MRKVELPEGVLYQGNCLKVLDELEEGSVQLCVTSPPYWRLRVYLDEDDEAKQDELGSEKLHDCLGWATREPCKKCYVCHLVRVFRKVRRVLREDGVLVLNLGDCYSSGGMGPGSEKYQEKAGEKTTNARNLQPKKPPPGLKPKDLCGIPYRVALALQADGWYWRCDIPWIKRGAMVESCEDRPSRALENISLFSKSPDYYWDQQAIKRPSKQPGCLVSQGEQSGSLRQAKGARLKPSGNANKKYIVNPTDRNFRNTDLWLQSLQAPHGLVGAGDELVGLDITSKGTKLTHFASYPIDLVKPFILAGTSQHGCCSKCGKCYQRIVSRKRNATRPGKNTKLHESKYRDEPVKVAGATRCNRDPQRHVTTVKTLGWEQDCSCQGGKPVPCTVLDPFSGIATTSLTALLLGRHFVGIELSREYFEAGVKRLKLRGQYRGEPVTEKSGFQGFEL